MGLLFYAAFVQIYFVVGPWKGYLSPHCILYVFLTIMAAISHSRCQFTDPGAVPLEIDVDTEASMSYNNINPENKKQYCKRCQRPKPPDAHHCGTCGRCVIRMGNTHTHTHTLFL